MESGSSSGGRAISSASILRRTRSQPPWRSTVRRWRSPSTSGARCGYRWAGREFNTETACSHRDGDGIPPRSLRCPVGSKSLASAPPPSGGTLRVAVPGDFPPPSTLASSGPAGVAALDPLVGFYDSLELMRCCLLRSLVSYVGRPTDDGGTVLQPDLAESLPEVSADGLTWTFRLRQIDTLRRWTTWR